MDPFSNRAAGISVGQAPAPKSQITDFDHINEVLNRAAILTMRIEVLAERLCGASPKMPQSATDAAEPSGVLPRIGAAAQSAYSRMSDGLEALDRIERALP